MTLIDFEDAERLRRIVRSNVTGSLILRLETTDLPPGRYQIRLFGDHRSIPLAVYVLDWRRP